MPRINLLPWREEERKKRQRDFGVAAAGSVVAGIATVMLTMFVFQQMIDAQNALNDRLKAPRFRRPEPETLTKLAVVRTAHTAYRQLAVNRPPLETRLSARRGV